MHEIKKLPITFDSEEDFRKYVIKELAMINGNITLIYNILADLHFNKYSHDDLVKEIRQELEEYNKKIDTLDSVITAPQK